MEYDSDFDIGCSSLTKKEFNSTCSKHAHSSGRVNHNARHKSSGLLNKQRKNLNKQRKKSKFDDLRQISFSNSDSDSDSTKNTMLDTIQIDLTQLEAHERKLIHEERRIRNYELTHAHMKARIKLPCLRPVAIASHRRDIIVSKARRNRDLVM